MLRMRMMRLWWMVMMMMLVLVKRLQLETRNGYSIVTFLVLIGEEGI